MKIFTCFLFIFVLLCAARTPLACAYDEREALMFLSDENTAEEFSRVEDNSALTIRPAQRVVLLEVIDCLNESIENRDLAEFLRGNFPDNKIMKEAAQNLMYGRHNPTLAAEIKKLLEE